MQGGELIWDHNGSLLARLHGFGIDLLSLVPRLSLLVSSLESLGIKLV